MSRSHRKPYIKDSPGKEMKRIAARAVRNAAQVADGSAYKRQFDSYDLCDFRWHVDKPVSGRALSYPHQRPYGERLRAYRKAIRK